MGVNEVPFQATSWLMPIILLAAQALPLHQASSVTCPRARQDHPPHASSMDGISLAAAFVAGLPRVLTRDDSQVERLCVSRRPSWRPSTNRPRLRRRPSALATMDVDGPPEISGGDGKRRVAMREEVLRQQKERAATTSVQLPNVQAPTDLPQPGEWLQMPHQLNSQRAPYGLQPDNKNTDNNKEKADPFTVPDNDYTDSFLDKLWINLLSSRMSAAVQTEALNAKGSERSTIADDSTKSRSAYGSGNDNADSPIGPALAAAAGADATVMGRKGAGQAGEGIGGASRAFAKAAGGGSRGTAPTAPRRGGGMGGGYRYEDYVALATELQAGAPERQREVVRGVLRSVFPAWFSAFYRLLFPPSKFSAEVNAFMCPPLFGWLVGKSELTEGVIDIKARDGKGPSKEVWRSTVKVERCRYLEASKCKGTCMNLCKLPTEAFFREDLGMPLRMTPNFEDLSCEFAFGQDALPAEEDPLMQEPCWTACLSSGKQPRKTQRPCHTMPESPLRGP